MHRLMAFAVLLVLPLLAGCAHRSGNIVGEESCPPPAIVEPGHVHAPGCGHMFVAGIWLDWDQDFVDHSRWFHGPRVAGAPHLPIPVPFWGWWYGREGPGVTVPDTRGGR
jgi:hypothetical protein